MAILTAALAHGRVAVVSLANDSAAILLGNGNGFLQSPDVNTNVAPQPLASDLGDLDGDGDLDWVVSSFSGEWTVFTNRGTGAFTPNQTIAATQAASCALAMDVDNDGVLELVLIDELQDTVKIFDNQ